MNRGQEIERTKYYVETECRNFLIAHKDIKGIEYRHRGNTEDSFIKIDTAFGTANFYDTTGLDRESICLLLSSIMTGVDVSRKLNDREAIREVAALFS